jgi:pseudouridine kinase
VQHLALLNVQTSLITALGNDSEAEFITANFKNIGVDMDQSIIAEDSTGKYVSILNPDGNLYVSACQDISFKYITDCFLESKANFIKKFDLIVIDTNLDEKAIQWIIDFAKINNKKLIIEPVSVIKASKLSNLNLEGVYMITPNEEELIAISTIKSDSEEILINAILQKGVAKIWIRKGDKGSVIHRTTQSTRLSVPSIQITDSTGAGDAALAGWIFGFVNKEDELTSLQFGHSLALEILKIKGTVDFSINKENLYNIKKTYYNE